MPKLRGLRAASRPCRCHTCSTHTFFIAVINNATNRSALRQHLDLAKIHALNSKWIEETKEHKSKPCRFKRAWSAAANWARLSCGCRCRQGLVASTLQPPSAFCMHADTHCGARRSAQSRTGPHCSSSTPGTVRQCVKGSSSTPGTVNAHLPHLEQSGNACKVRGKHVLHVLPFLQW